MGMEEEEQPVLEGEAVHGEEAPVVQGERHSDLDTP